MISRSTLRDPSENHASHFKVIIPCMLVISCHVLRRSSVLEWGGAPRLRWCRTRIGGGLIAASLAQPNLKTLFTSRSLRASDNRTNIVPASWTGCKVHMEKTAPACPSTTDCYSVTASLASGTTTRLSKMRQNRTIRIMKPRYGRFRRQFRICEMYESNFASPPYHHKPSCAEL